VDVSNLVLTVCLSLSIHNRLREAALILFETHGAWGQRTFRFYDIRGHKLLDIEYATSDKQSQVLAYIYIWDASSEGNAPVVYTCIKVLHTAAG